MPDLLDPSLLNLLRELSAQAANRAVEQAPMTRLRPGTVVELGAELVLVLLDGDVDPVQVQNLTTTAVVPGDRVMVFLQPPHGAFLIGVSQLAGLWYVDPRKYGAIGDDLADDTDGLTLAFEAADLTELPLGLFGGQWRYGGPGLVPSRNHWSILGAGAGMTKITMTAASYLVVASTITPKFPVCRGFTVEGGLGFLNCPLTADSTGGQRLFEDMEYLDYTECAVQVNSVDCPHWRFTHCTFAAATDQGTIGFAHNGSANGSEFSCCSFRRNQIKMKLVRAQDVYLSGGEFLHNGGPEPVDNRVDLWIVPWDPIGGGAEHEGFTATRWKFGGEHSKVTDYRVLLAQEDTGSGTDVGTRYPDYGTATDNLVDGISFVQCKVNMIGGRTVADGATTIGLTAISSVDAHWTAEDVGRPIGGVGIPPGAVIASEAGDGVNADLDVAATATGSGVTFHIEGAHSFIHTLTPRVRDLSIDVCPVQDPPQEMLHMDPLAIALADEKVRSYGNRIAMSSNAGVMPVELTNVPGFLQPADSFRCRRLAGLGRTGIAVTTIDPDLQLYLPAGNYELDGYLVVEGPSAAGLGIQWNGPPDADPASLVSFFGQAFGGTTSTGAWRQDAVRLQVTVGMTTVAGTPLGIRVAGFLQFPSRGNFSLRWAQQVNNATATFLHGWVEARPVFL